MEEIKKILTIEFDGQKTIADVKAEIAQLKKELDSCAAGSEEATKKADELAQAELNLKAAMKGAVDETGKLTKSYNGLSKQMAKLKAAQKQVDLSTKDGRKQFEAYAKEINKINSQLKDLDAKNGVFSRNVGDYANQMGKAFGGMASTVTSAFSSIEAGLKALIANPWVAIITAILLAIKQLADAIKRNDSAMLSVKKSFNNVKAVLVVIQRAFDSFVAALMDSQSKTRQFFSSIKDAITDVWEFIKPYYQKLFNFYKSLLKAYATLLSKYLEFMDGIVTAGIKGFAYIKAAWDAVFSEKTFSEALEETETAWLDGWENLKQKTVDTIKGIKDAVVDTVKDIADGAKKEWKKAKALLDAIDAAELKLAKDHIANTKAIAKNNEEIARLNAIAADKEGQSIDEREKAAKEAAELQKKNIDIQISEANERLRIAQLRHSLNKSNVEDMQEEADITAEIINLKAQKNEADRNFNAQQKTFAEERLKEARQIIAAEKSSIEELLSITQKGTDEHLQLTLDKINKEKELAILEAKSRIKDEEKLRETLLLIDAKYDKKELNAIEQHNKDLADARNLEATNTVNKTSLEYGSNSLEFYQAELDAAKTFYDNLFQLESESDAEYEARVIASQKRIADAETKVQQKRLSNYTNLANGIADIMDTVAGAWEDNINRQIEAGEISQEEGEKQFEAVKAMQIAIATIQMITGIVTALSGTWTTKSGPWDIALAAVQAAGIAAGGIANIVKIKNTTLSSAGSTSSAGAASFQLPSLESYTPNYTQNLTGTSDVDNIGKSVKDAIESAEVRAYVVESDVTNAQRRAERRTSEATW